MNKIICCFLLLFFTVKAHAQWTSSGPSGMTVYCSAQIGKGLYIGTPAGIYRSLDSGVTFSMQSANLPGISVQCLFFDSTVLYAGFGDISGIFISGDTGKTWTLSNKGIISQFYPNDQSFLKINNKVFCSYYNGTYYTIDHGLTWKQILFPGALGQVNLPMFAVGNYLFRQQKVSGDFTLYRSADEGVNWVLADSGLNDIDIAAMYRIADTLYTFTREQVYTSANEGLKWTPMTYSPFKLANGVVFSCGKICYNGKRFFSIFNSSSNPNVLSIEPGSKQWMVTKGSPSGIYPYCIFSMGIKVFVGGFENFYATVNNGDYWELLDSTGCGTMRITALAVTGNHLFALSSAGIHHSDDNGLSWHRPVKRYLSVSCLSTFGNTVLAGTYGSGIYITDNYGLYWKSTSLTVGGIYAMANNGKDLYAGGILNSGTSAYKSKDGGITWNYFHSGWITNSVGDMLVKGNNVFAAFIPQSIPGIYKSPTSSSNWMPASNGLPSQGNYSLAAIGNTIYTGTPTGVFKSTDDGASWTSENAGIESRRTYALAVSGQTLFAGTDIGVFVLYGGTGSWEKIRTNMPVRTINKLVVSGNYLYAATFEGSVWQISLQSLGLNEPKKQLSTLEVYPNPANEDLTLAHIQLATGDEVRLMDLSGRAVETKIINEATESVKMSTANLAEGIYFVQLVKDGNLLTRKFVVVH